MTLILYSKEKVGLNDNQEGAKLGITNCFRCGLEICFDPKIVGRGTGRCIPLDIESRTPHRCTFRKEIAGNDTT